MTEELWKDIPGYEGYQVSNLGNVRSLKYKHPRLLKPGNNGVGYKQVMLYNQGIGKMYTVHRLVAEQFIPNPENKPCIDHINAIRDDNRAENLRYVTHSENNLNPITIKHFSESKIGNDYSKGKKRSEETIYKLSQSHKGIKHTEEWKQQRSVSMRGENNPFWGKHHTEESKEKISKTKRGL